MHPMLEMVRQRFGFERHVAKRTSEVSQTLPAVQVELIWFWYQTMTTKCSRTCRSMYSRIEIVDEVSNWDTWP